MALTDFQSQVDDLVGLNDDEIITTTIRDREIANAVHRYSEMKPRTLVVDLMSAGGYRLDLPAGWVDGLSELIQLEYPVGEVPIHTIELEHICFYRSPSDQMIELPVSLTSGETVRVTFSGTHTVDVSTDTVPARHREGVCYLAAAACCQILATYYANESEPTIGADTVDRKSKSSEYRSLARSYTHSASESIGAPQRGLKPAGVVADLDLRDSRGRDRIFHERRFR